MGAQPTSVACLISLKPSPSLFVFGVLVHLGAVLALYKSALSLSIQYALVLCVLLHAGFWLRREALLRSGSSPVAFEYDGACWRVYFRDASVRLAADYRQAWVFRALLVLQFSFEVKPFQTLPFWRRVLRGWSFGSLLLCRDRVSRIDYRRLVVHVLHGL